MKNIYNEIIDFQRRIFIASGPYLKKIFALIFLMILPIIILTPIITRSMLPSEPHDVMTNYIIQRKEAFLLPFEMLFFGLFARVLDSERFWIILLVAFLTSSWAVILVSYFPPFKT